MRNSTGVSGSSSIAHSSPETGPSRSSSPPIHLKSSVLGFLLVRKWSTGLTTPSGAECELVFFAGSRHRTLFANFCRFFEDVASDQKDFREDEEDLVPCDPVEDFESNVAAAVRIWCDETEGERLCFIRSDGGM